MSYDNQMPGSATPDTEKSAVSDTQNHFNDNLSIPDEDVDAPVSQNRMRLYHQLKETSAKLTPDQYLQVLMSAVNSGLLNNDEFLSFGDPAAIDNEEVFSPLASSLPKYLLEKLEKLFTTAEDVKDAVAGKVKVVTENV